MRGNDGGGFGKIAPPVFRRPFASSVYIVAWALPTIMLGTKRSSEILGLIRGIKPSLWVSILSCYVFFARRSDSRIRHFQQFFGNDRRVKCFCRIQVSDLHLDSCLRGNDGGGFDKNCFSRFQTTICLVGVHCNVGLVHDNDG